MRAVSGLWAGACSRGTPCLGRRPSEGDAASGNGRGRIELVEGGQLRTGDGRGRRAERQRLPGRTTGEHPGRATIGGRTTAPRTPRRLSQSRRRPGGHVLTSTWFLSTIAERACTVGRRQATCPSSWVRYLQNSAQSSRAADRPASRSSSPRRLKARADPPELSGSTRARSRTVVGRLAGAIHQVPTPGFATVIPMPSVVPNGGGETRRRRTRPPPRRHRSTPRAAAGRRCPRP